MSKYNLLLSLLCLLTACKHSSPNQMPVAIQQDTVISEIDLRQQEPDIQILPPLDSSAYVWEDGHLVLSWSELAQVEFEWAYSEEVGEEVPFPLFSSSLKILDGRAVQVAGYAIPMEETGTETFVILSAFPYSQCFFCGQAGPESVIDVIAGAKLPRLSVDDKTTFRGRLRLNDDDLRYLNYILEEAELVD